MKNLEYETVEEFLADLKKEFERRDKKVVKMAELKRLKLSSKDLWSQNANQILLRSGTREQ